MKIIDRIFRKKQKSDMPPISKDIPSMPKWEDIVKIMYDKELDRSDIENVIYSKDNSMRYLILRKSNKLMTFMLEALYPFDEDEWKYLSRNKNVLPAMWFFKKGNDSFFETKEELLNELKNEPEYKTYFE